MSQAVNIQEQRMHQAAGTWAELSDEQRAKATASFLMRHASFARMVYMVPKAEEMTQRAMGDWADDFERTFGLPAPWRAPEQSTCPTCATVHPHGSPCPVCRDFGMLGKMFLEGEKE